MKPRERLLALSSKNYRNGHLPAELEPYREFEMPAKFKAWLEQNRNGNSGLGTTSRKIVPTWDGRRVIYDGKICKTFARPATNQSDILEVFEDKDWERKIRLPPHLMSNKCISETIHDMNRWPNSTIKFGRESGAVTWRPRPVPAPANTPKLP